MARRPSVASASRTAPATAPETPQRPAEPPFPPAAVAWAAVGILVVLTILSLLDRQIISLMVQMIKADFGVSDSRIGLLQGAAFSLIYSVAAFPFGHAADRYPRRLTLFIGVFAWAVAATACGLATSFNALLAARLGVGLGEAAIYPVAASMLSDLFPKHRLAFAFSVISVGALIGTWGALIIGGLVISWAGDGMTVPLLGFLEPWQLTFIVTGVPGMLLAGIIFLIPEPQRRASAAEAASQASWSDAWAFVKQNAAFLAYYLGGFGVLSIAGYSLMSWTPTALQRVYGMTPGAIGLSFGPIAIACGVIGTLGSGLIVDRLYARGRRDAQAVFFGLGAVVMIPLGVATLFAPWSGLYMVMMASFILVLNFGGVAAAGLQTVAPAYLRGRIMALFGFATGVAGATLGPSLVPFFTDVVFRDESKVHWSLAAAMSGAGVVATILFALSRKAMLRAVAAAEAAA